MNRNHRTTLVAALALGAALLAPADAHARSGYYDSTTRGASCASCHDPAPTTCNGCHFHRGIVSGSLPKASFAAGESFTVTVKAGGDGGFWGAAVLDDKNNVVGTASATDSGSATVTVKAPSASGTYAWKAAWYGHKWTSTPSAATWVADPTRAGHGYVTVALSTFTVAGPAPTPSTPSASLSPTTLDLGTVTTGKSATKTATVTNSGTGSLSVTAITSCDSNTSAFITLSPSAAFTVAAGGSTTLTVTFAPSSTGAARGCWNLATNDTAHPTLQLTASGTAQAAGSSSSSGGASSSGGSSSGGRSSSGGSTSSSSGSTSSGGAHVEAGGCSSAGGALPLLGLLGVALGALRRRRAG